MARAIRSLLLLLLLAPALAGCVSTVIGEAVDVVVEVAKVPFKVGGAVVDVMTEDEDEDD